MSPERNAADHDGQSAETSSHSDGGDTKHHESSQAGGSRSADNRHSKDVNRLRLFISVLMVLTAFTFGIVVFLFNRNAEADDFESHFEDVAHQLLNLVQDDVNSAVHATKTLATTITSHAIESGTQWPAIVVPHYERHGMDLSKLAKVAQLSIIPSVHISQLDDWNSYSVDNQNWIMDGLKIRFSNESLAVNDITGFIFRLDDDGFIVPQTEAGDSGKFLPVWQQYPAPSDPAMVNFDLTSVHVFEEYYNLLVETNSPVLSSIVNLDFLLQPYRNTSEMSRHSFLMQPLYADFTNTTAQFMVGCTLAVFAWEELFENVIHSDEEEVIVVLSNTCGESLTFQTNADHAIAGDMHDSNFDNLAVSLKLVLDGLSYQEEHGVCSYSVTVYPTNAFQDEFFTSAPLLYGALAILLFFFTTVVFGVYDFVVQRRQREIIAKAERTNKLVSDLFPQNVKDRLLEDGYGKGGMGSNHMDGGGRRGSGHIRKDLKTDMTLMSRSNSVSWLNPYETKPIADLFPNATVMFGDLVGFTAWSSMREPTQVFTLLETLYHAFDQIAKRRRVFKVETVGDCYVAVTGLPEARKDHAVVMARFAKDCMKKMNELTKQLITVLGPDTADLSMRIGIHSGPVTAGVLRGEKSRFQLFGDTVNTAARIEATGEANRIHISQETADLLKDAGKTAWFKTRTNTVTPKGKGEMQTYWIDSEVTTHGKGSENETDSVGSSTDEVSMYGDDESVPEQGDEFEKLGLKEMGLDADDFDEQTQRLVRYNAEVLLRLLKQIIARRLAVQARNQEKGVEVEGNDDPVMWPKSGLTPLEEVQEIIRLPEYDSFIAKYEPAPDSIEIDPEVVAQLNDFVRIIASMYRSNPFHNFQHASHVAMSVSKLLSRIVAPSHLGLGNLDESIHSSNVNTRAIVKSTLHDHTYGITSDPLTQFACVLSALFHDADHPGVPNTQLVKEKAYTARLYNNKSVAEQNSVDACWDLLMDVNFRALRNTICVTEDEQKRFRHLIVNSVMATDIVDKELKALRNARWERAFSQQEHQESQSEIINRKATIVIEHLIQASDIAHTMQHWHIYRKWNERLYQELLIAYRNGRSETDPSDGWYKGEIGFFDFYIIPLAKKLKECGVFGVSTDEYLSYALQNRANWVQKGQEITAAMIEKYRDDAETPENVKLDSIQDSDGGALRSNLISNETQHGSSSHSIRAMHNNPLDLDMDAMSAASNASFGSFALSTAKSSKSLCSSTETILEDSKEWNGDETETVEKDDFYSSDSSNASDSSSSGSDDDSDSMDDDDLASERGDTNTRMRSLPSRNVASWKPSHPVEAAALNSSSDWGQNSAESFANDVEPPMQTKQRVSKKNGDSPHEILPKLEACPRGTNNKSLVDPPAQTSEGKIKPKTTGSSCSTTQANTEWEQNTCFQESTQDPLEAMDVYCLQQRINNRLVGSIKNTRAYDKKPSEQEMIFF